MPKDSIVLRMVNVMVQNHISNCVREVTTAKVTSRPNESIGHKTECKPP